MQGHYHISRSYMKMGLNVDAFTNRKHSAPYHHGYSLLCSFHLKMKLKSFSCCRMILFFNILM